MKLSEFEEFSGRLSELSKQDICKAYMSSLIEQVPLDEILYHKESDTLFAYIETDTELWCIRLEGNRHRASRRMIRFIQLNLERLDEKKKKNILIKTKKCFYNDKAKKLLKLTGFRFFAETNGFIISKWWRS